MRDRQITDKKQQTDKRKTVDRQQTDKGQITDIQIAHKRLPTTDNRQTC